MYKSSAQLHTYIYCKSYYARLFCKLSTVSLLCLNSFICLRSDSVKQRTPVFYEYQLYLFSFSTLPLGKQQTLLDWLSVSKPVRCYGVKLIKRQVCSHAVFVLHLLHCAHLTLDKNPLSSANIWSLYSVWKGLSRPSLPV